jgi:hypothetical protein
MPETEARQSPLRCYRCGASLQALSLPLARLDLCPDCSVELHVCRMCRHYAPSAPDACDEDDAPEVHNKTAANFCDYFQPTPDAFDGREQRAENKARTELEALFGGEPGTKAQQDDEPADDRLQRAEDLFRK